MDARPLKLNAGFGARHPECGKGELFIGYSDLTGFTSSQWTSKRRGVKVIDDNGVDVTELAAEAFFPMFMQSAEFHASMSRSLQAA